MFCNYHAAHYATANAPYGLHFTALLIVMVQHWIFLTGLWNMPERSLVKGGQMIKEQAARTPPALMTLTR